MDGAFNTALDLPKTETTLTYLIISQPRTGSNLIAAALSKTGCAGVPDEYFNREYLMRLPQPLTMNSVKAYYQDIVSRRTSTNGVFGMKVHSIQFQNIFMEKDAVTSAGQNFLKSFDKIILTSRRDKIAQAMSNIIAFRTGNWMSGTKDNEGKQNYEFTREDAPLVLTAIRSAVEGELFWNKLCEQFDLKPLRVVYEELSQSPQTELRKIAAHLGLPDTDISPQSVKQSRDSNREAKKAFLNYLGVEWNAAD